MIRTSAFLAVLWSGLAAAKGPVILVEEKIAPYRAAAAAARPLLGSAVTVEPTDPTAASQAAQASVILAIGQKAFDVAREAPGSAPIVFCMVLGVDPAVLTDRMTGVPIESDPAVVIAHIRALAPRIRTVGMVYHPKNSGLLVQAAQKAAVATGMALVLRPVQSAADVRGAVAGIAGAVDLLWLPPDPKLFSKELFAFLLSVSAERKLPLLGFLDGFTQAGALASVSADFADIGARAGKLAAELQPGRALPPVRFAPGTLSVNLKTAQALGIEVPAAAVAQAKQVFR